MQRPHLSLDAPAWDTLRSSRALAEGAGALRPARASSAWIARSTSLDCLPLLPSTMPLPLGGAALLRGAP